MTHHPCDVVIDTDSLAFQYDLACVEYEEAYNDLVQLINHCPWTVHHEANRRVNLAFQERDRLLMACWGHPHLEEAA